MSSMLLERFTAGINALAYAVHIKYCAWSDSDSTAATECSQFASAHCSVSSSLGKELRCAHNF